eukprot:9251157-Pyramimonas_sp.AAC.1
MRNTDWAGAGPPGASRGPAGDTATAGHRTVSSASSRTWDTTARSSEISRQCIQFRVRGGCA